MRTSLVSSGTLTLLLLTASVAHAVPTLQLYIEGSTYDMATETWLLAPGATDTMRLWVIGDTKKGSIADVRLAVAYNSMFSPLNPQIGLSPTDTGGYNGFTDPSIAGVPVYRDTFEGGVPQLGPLATPGDPLSLPDGTGKYLPTHGIYNEYTEWQEFWLGEFSLADSPIADFSGISSPTVPDPIEHWGQINVYEVTIANAPENMLLHFDVYNSIEGANHSIFAPFSHDGAGYVPPGEEPPPIPEPAGMIMLGCLGAGMLMARRTRRMSK